MARWNTGIEHVKTHPEVLLEGEPQIAEDYERMWRVLKSSPCDIFLGAHGGYFGLKKISAHEKKVGEPIHRS